VYVEAAFMEPTDTEPHLLPLQRRLSILRRIVEVEGPVHEDEVARKFASVCGRERAGRRIQGAAKRALQYAVREGLLSRDGRFYTVHPVTECPPRDRSAVRSTTLRDPRMLPPIEILTALCQIVRDHIGVGRQEAVVEAARLLGFHRTGHDLQRVIEEQLQIALESGRLVAGNGDSLFVP
jgi:hypothetical protein